MAYALGLQARTACKDALVETASRRAHSKAAAPDGLGSTPTTILFMTVPRQR